MADLDRSISPEKDGSCVEVAEDSQDRWVVRLRDGQIQLRVDAGHVPHNRFAAMKPDEPNVYVLPFARKIPTPDVHESVANTTSSGNSA